MNAFCHPVFLFLFLSLFSSSFMLLSNQEEDEEIYSIANDNNTCTRKSTFLTVRRHTFDNNT